MLKRKVLKRILPILLSLAMAFQSVPMTAMAEEIQPAAEETVAAEPAAEPAEDAPDDQSDESADTNTGTGSAENEGGSGAQPGTDASADTGTDAGPETDNATDDKPEADAGTDASAEAGQEIPPTGVGADEQAEAGSAEISFSELDYWLNYDNNVFKRVEGENSLTYTASYSEDTRFSSVINNVKNAVVIKVNGETVSNIKDDYLTLEWREKTGDNWAAMTGLPQNVGSYALHLEVKSQEGVWEKDEEDIFFHITPRKLMLEENSLNAVLDSVKAGSKVADFKDAVVKACMLVDEWENEFTALKYIVTVKVCEVGAAEETADAVFSRNKDYRAEIAVKFEDETAGRNYEVSGAEYPVGFDGLQETKVETKNPVSEMAKTYGAAKTYTASGIAEEYKVTADVKVKDSEGTFVPIGADVPVRDAVAKWYTKEANKEGYIEGFPEEGEIDETTQFIGADGALYTLVTEEGDEKKEAAVGDVGDYYLVFVYEGVENQYEGSHSTPLKFTIDPVEVILKPGEVASLSTAMDASAIASALAKVEPKFYTLDETDPTKGAAENSSANKELEENEDFFGVSYDKAEVTQYYSPVFELMCKTRTRLPKESWPANATEEQKWREWSELDSASVIKADTDDKQYKYFVRFSGKKAVYQKTSDTEGYTKTDEISINEATDSANRNYKVKTDEDTLKNEANMFEVKPGEAVKTTINVQPIIDGFKNGGRYMGGVGLDASDPAWTIYDPDAMLFADKASYKKAVVNDQVKDTHKDITYTWESRSIDSYYELTRDLAGLKQEEGETAEQFKERKDELIRDFEDEGWDSSWNQQDAALYRLHVEYKDSDLDPKNESAEGYAYFLIKKQELMLVADTQYASYGDYVWEFSQSGYRMYKLPDNKEELKDENLLNWDGESLDWYAMNLEKKEDGSDSDKWVYSTGTFVKNETNPYKYKAAVWFSDRYGEIEDTDGNPVKNNAGEVLNWENYTTHNMDAWDADRDEYKNHYKVGDGFGDFVFGAAKFKIAVDRTKLFADKTYDAKPIADKLPDGFVTLTDENGAAIPDSRLQINGEPKDGVGTVQVAWWWNGPNKTVPTEDVKFGGTYTLVAKFDGCTYADGTSYAPTENWEELKDENGKPYEFTINPLKVEIAPGLNETMTAGDKVSDILLDEGRQIDFKPANEGEKIPEEDEWLFNYGGDSRWNAIQDKEVPNSGYPVLNGEKFSVSYYKDNKPANSERVRSGNDYVVKLSDSGLFAQYAYSYDLTYTPATLTKDKIVRGDADVWDVDFFENADGNRGSVAVYRKEKADGTYEILPREGIPFIYDNYSIINRYGNTVTEDLITGEDIPLDRNYIAVRIVSPREFDAEFKNDYKFAEKNFVYGNSIRAAGGYVIGRDGYSYNEDRKAIKRYFITALFPVELDENGRPVELKPFSVTWEKGYTDTFKIDLSNAQAEANLQKAVAPKSLAFNGVISKMAVGEEQQLDVKITKAQLGDVVRINYRLAGDRDKEFASIDPETGRITALKIDDSGAKPKPAAVNVEAFPVRLAADGRTYEPIDKDEKGKAVKAAKTKITVTPVDAPVIKKIVPADTEAELQYTSVNNGYRREIYVRKLEGKSDAANWKKPEQFEDAIKKIKNGQWKGTFAIAPEYISRSNERDYCYDTKLKLNRASVRGLEAGVDKGAYVVYIRNVSAVRTLADGSKVSESAAGTVKAFETTKSQVTELIPYFEVEDEWSKTNPVRYIGEKEEQEGYPKNERDYTVNLFDKSAQVLVDGSFKKKPMDPSADDEDTIDLPLSLKTAEKSGDIKYTDTYLDPKLTYYVTDGDWPELDEKGKIKNPSKYVTISNKGKLTFKGVDKDGDLWVTVYVKADPWDGSSFGFCKLRITARPDTLTTKKTKPMKVGDAIRLRDYIEYKQGKTKVPNFWSSSLSIENWSDVEQAGFAIYRAEDDGETHPSIDGTLRKDEYIIIAKKDGAECSLKLKDWLWPEESEDRSKEVTDENITLKTTKIDPVKGLKVVYTDDKHITLNFGHAGHPEAFDIEVTDARGSVIYKKLAYRDDESMNVIPTDLSEWWGNDVPAWVQSAVTNLQRANLAWVNQWDLSDGNLGDSNFVYFEKTKTYAYTIDTEKLMRLSAYTVSVTPVYDGERAAKPAATKAKTTDIPASYADGDVVNPDNNFEGAGLVFNRINGSYLTSGNTYTLSVGSGEYNDLARERGTDTLTWKSSNTKVASVKANQGSFSATVKAAQQGRTTITVTSKVTKKTIARYHIAVKAVGKGNSYGGDYESGNNWEFFDQFIWTVDPYYEGRVKVLTVKNPVQVDDADEESDRTWVKFTAPSYGEYTFSCDSYYKNYKIFYNTGREAVDEDNGDWGSKTLRLEEGQTIYFRVVGEFTLRVSRYTDFTKLTTSFTEDKPLTVEKTAWVSFTAPEDNYYTFHGNISEYEDSVGSRLYLENDSKGMKAGETIFIKANRGSLWVTRREFAGKDLAVNGEAGVTFDKKNAEDTQYIRFKADVAGDYKFTYSPASKITVKFLAVDGKTVYTDGNAVIGKKVSLMSETAAPETPAADEGGITLFMDAGESVAIAVELKSGMITEETPTVPVKISAKSTAVLPLTAKQTVPMNTTQMFAYTIPDDKAATKYTVAASEGGTITWYYSDSNRYDENLRVISNIQNDSFEVKDGRVAGISDLKAGDKIYIKIAAAADKDSEVTLTSVADSRTFGVGAPASVTLGADGDAEWFTFTAKKAGYYEFTNKVSTTPEGSAKQNATVKLVERAFSESDRYVGGYINLADGGTSGIEELPAGDYVFMIRADSAAAEGVKTTVSLSVKEVVPKAIGKGDTAVAVAQGGTEYYSFRAADNGSYTIRWTPDKDTGTSEALYTSSGLVNIENGSTLAPATPIDVSSSDTYTIAVKATGDKAVSGKLQIAAETKDFLTSGKAADFEITKAGEEKTYKFTLPEQNALGYVVIVENTSTAPEGKTVPAITVNGVVTSLGKGKKAVTVNWSDKAFTTKLIRITATDVTEASEGVDAVKATGRITIKPVTVNPYSAAVGNVKKGDEPRWYTDTVKSDGRYQLGYAVGDKQDKGTVVVTWYKKNVYSNGSVSKTMITDEIPYLTKGQGLYVCVEAKDTIADAGVDVTLNDAPLQTTELKLENGKKEQTVDAKTVENGPVYYTFNPTVYARYDVTGSSGIRLYVPENSSDAWYGDTLEKDQMILIKVTEPGTLTITQGAITELKPNVPSGEITLKDGETADFVLNVFKSGYYDFQVSDAKNLAIDRGDILYEDINNQCYFVTEIDAGSDKRYEFGITNNTGADVKLNVTAGALMANPLQLGETDVPVAKGRASVVEFEVPEDHWYTVACGAGNKLLLDGEEVGGTDVFWTKTTEGEVSKCGVLVPGAEAAASAKVTITKLAPQEVKGEEIGVTLEPHEIRWYAYRTTAMADYSFVPALESVDLTFYRSLGSKWTIWQRPVMSAADTDLYIKVVNNSDSKVEGENGKIRVTWKEEVKLNLGENAISAESGNTYLTFKASEDGMYSFDRGDFSYLQYYGERAGNQSELLENRYKIFVKKDSIIYLSMRNDKAVNSNITVTKADDAVRFLGHVDIKAGKYQWITFTAPAKGTYTFAPENVKADNTKAWFIENRADVGNNAKFEELDDAASSGKAWGSKWWYYDRVNNNNYAENQIDLEEGETVNIAVGCYDYNFTEATSCDVYVRTEQ